MISFDLERDLDVNLPVANVGLTRLRLRDELIIAINSHMYTSYFWHVFMCEMSTLAIVDAKRSTSIIFYLALFEFWEFPRRIVLLKIGIVPIPDGNFRALFSFCSLRKRAPCIFIFDGPKAFSTPTYVCAYPCWMFTIFNTHSSSSWHRSYFLIHIIRLFRYVTVLPKFESNRTFFMPRQWKIYCINAQYLYLKLYKFRFLNQTIIKKSIWKSLCSIFRIKILLHRPRFSEE